MIKNKTLCFLLVASFFISSTTISFGSNPTTTKIDKDTQTNLEISSIDANWTVMFYLCCENHISYEAERKIQGLSEIGSSSDLNIIALKDGNQDNDSILYYIEKNNPMNLNQAYDWPDEVDMGDPNTLSSFIELVKENYPAKNYALYILSDMGSGWQGICHDTRNPNNGLPLMSFPTFSNVLKTTTNDEDDKLDVIIFNPCVVGMFEVAYELSPNVDYMVASEEHMLEELDKGPEYVTQYKQTIWNLKNNTDMNPEEFAISFVDNYNSCDFPMWALYSYMILMKKGDYSHFVAKLSNFLTKLFNSLPNSEFHFIEIKTTLSAINLSKMKELGGSIGNLSSVLLLNQDDEDTLNAVSNARKNVREYGKFYTKDKNLLYYLNFPLEKNAFDSFVDLYDLVYLLNDSSSRQTVKHACRKVMSAFEESIIANSAMPDDSSYGLSIYFPKSYELYNKYLWEDEITYKYEDLNFSKNSLWDEFLNSYLGTK